MLKFEDFAKLEIRIGTIISAERVAKTDRLIKVVVDLGFEQRQVIAGFGHKHNPEDLMGKQVPIVINIEKALIRGEESNGIFVAIDDENATLLLPEKPVSNGSKLK